MSPLRFEFQRCPPLSLYVHVPWCLRKCPYCDFNSHALRGRLPEDEYVQALLRDLEGELCHVGGRRVESVFFGGGTPSLLSPSAVRTLLRGFRSRLEISDSAEITLEANPGTIDPSRLAELRDAGVTRLSIGVQSFQSELLGRIGRIHNGDEALSAVEAAGTAGFADLNLDLMFGLPGQTAEQALADLKTALGLLPSHISHYRLTIEPGTRFYRSPPEQPTDELLEEVEVEAQELFTGADFAHYEVSAYARPGGECRHNLNYWHFGDYLGIGAGAHGKLTEPEAGRIWRCSKTSHPREYLAKAGSSRSRAEMFVLSAPQAMLEFMMNALRLREGFTPCLYEERTGLAFSSVAHRLLKARRRGLMETLQERIRASDMGWHFLDELLTIFVD